MCEVSSPADAGQWFGHHRNQPPSTSSQSSIPAEHHSEAAPLVVDTLTWSFVGALLETRTVSSRPLRNPTAASRLLGTRAAITAKEILGATVNRAARDRVWACSNIYRSLQVVADLLARMDLALIDDTRDQVELSWTQALSPVLRNKLEPLVSVSYRGLGP